MSVRFYAVVPTSLTGTRLRVCVAFLLVSDSRPTYFFVRWWMFWVARPYRASEVSRVLTRVVSHA
jgi:hypothetical protein